MKARDNPSSQEQPGPPLVPIHISYPPLVLSETMMPTLAAVHDEIKQVRDALDRHENLLEQVLSELSSNGVEEIEIDEVDDAEARQRILALFEGLSGSLFYDEIAERLRLSLRQTVEVCNQLEAEGLIGEPDARS